MNIPVHQRYKLAAGTATGGTVYRWIAERSMDVRHWQAPSVKDSDHGAHLFMLSGGPIDAPCWLPAGSLRKVFKDRSAYFSDIPREIQTD